MCVLDVGGGPRGSCGVCSRREGRKGGQVRVGGCFALLGGVKDSRSTGESSSCACGTTDEDVHGASVLRTCCGPGEEGPWSSTCAMAMEGTSGSRECLLLWAAGMQVVCASGRTSSAAVLRFFC